jgi:rhodanese-related sulfurtransferase
MHSQEKLLVINVLPAEYHEDCAIKGSINVPLDRLAKFAEKLDKNSEIVVYCAHYKCSKSAEAWKLLDDMGFTNVWAYEGGVNEWKYAHCPTTGKCEKDYLEKKMDRPEGHKSKTKEISCSALLKMMQKHKLL